MRSRGGAGRGREWGATHTAQAHSPARRSALCRVLRTPRGAAFIGSVPQWRLAPPRRGQGGIGGGREGPLPAPPLRLVPRLPLPRPHWLIPNLARLWSGSRGNRTCFAPPLVGRLAKVLRLGRRGAGVRRRRPLGRAPSGTVAPPTPPRDGSTRHPVRHPGSLTTRRARRSPRAVLQLARNPRKHRSTPGRRHLLLSAQLPRHTLSLSPHLLSALGEGETGKW